MLSASNININNIESKSALKRFFGTREVLEAMDYYIIVI